MLLDRVRDRRNEAGRPRQIHAAWPGGRYAEPRAWTEVAAREHSARVAWKPSLMTVSH
jgi:hypothetical protein